MKLINIGLKHFQAVVVRIAIVLIKKNIKSDSLSWLGRIFHNMKKAQTNKVPNIAEDILLFA